MPNRVPWTERSFQFDFNVDHYPELIERLRGTPARAEEIVRELPPPVLVRRDGDYHFARMRSLLRGFA